MTPEEALSAAWGEYRARTQFFSVAKQSAFCDGFRAGLNHARRWRPLTSDEATRPPTGERVLFSWRTGVVGVGQLATRDMVLWDGYEYPIHPIADALAWLPLPPPSEEVGGG